jgi:hypothetical protein
VPRLPIDSPYGRLAQVTDDRGATFLVVQGQFLPVSSVLRSPVDFG